MKDEARQQRNGMDKYGKKMHTFAVCAYRESPYLEACIRSVQNQTVSSEIILITSTPCDYIEKLCRKYKIPYFVNRKGGITQDWNFAYQKSETPMVTIAHQDDIYFKRYTEQLIKMCTNAEDPLIFFTDYYEIRNKKMVRKDFLLYLKRAMLLPLQIPFLRKAVFIRRGILAFGSPICCPSVAFFRKNLPDVIFQNHFRASGDWEAWERISRLKGQFLYCAQPLMAHRIHKDSETTAAISDGVRTKEDLEMFQRFWPSWIAVWLNKHYKQSERFN